MITPFFFEIINNIIHLNKTLINTKYLILFIFQEFTGIPLEDWQLNILSVVTLR
ncbi:hypothetical protein EV146_104390 [Mesobacillus foraminis]|uniref:Uncharacterized protein n=1 Tax=Mesobacillus foraminis TaxID=279826 RepID=A0A4V2RDV5_9BACI|nr:hypothetical protein EV146_104390 [Mesobacillus foraminis]